MSDILTTYAVRTEVGMRSCGKSTFMIGEEGKNLPGLIGDYITNHNMRCIIIDPSNDREHPVDYHKLKVYPWRKIVNAKKFTTGAIRTIIDLPAQAEEFIWNLCGFHYNDKGKPVKKNDGVKNLLLVVDDAAMIVPQSWKDTAWERFALETKNKHNSIAFMYHGWKWIPPRLEALTNEYVIFKTTADQPQDRGIKNRDVLAAYDRVVNHSSRFYHEKVQNA